MEINSKGFIIGIDSGGTKCEVIIINTDKEIIFNKSYIGIHYSTSGAEVYSDHITDFILKSLSAVKLKLNDCTAIGIGAAGARESSDRSALLKLFRKKLEFKKIIITSDAMTALYGSFGGDEGIILISGTGSVLYGYCNDKITRVGGWGRIIGDEGSGYWIGKRALNLITKEYDRNKKKKSLLSGKLFSEFGIDKLNINRRIFQSNFEIQRIAPLVISSAVNKCKLSMKIVDEAVEGLMYHIITFLDVSKRKDKIKIAFIGSIIENKNILSDNLKKEIKKLKIVEVVVKANSPAYGAALLAAEGSDIIKKLS